MREIPQKSLMKDHLDQQTFPFSVIKILHWSSFIIIYNHLSSFIIIVIIIIIVYHHHHYHHHLSSSSSSSLSSSFIIIIIIIIYHHHHHHHHLSSSSSPSSSSLSSSFIIIYHRSFLQALKPSPHHRVIQKSRFRFRPRLLSGDVRLDARDARDGLDGSLSFSVFVIAEFCSSGKHRKKHGKSPC